jgi:hypothetical protein
VTLLIVVYYAVPSLRVETCGPTDLGWAMFYTLLGAAAPHPTMATLTEPVPRQEAAVSPGRLAVLMLASLIAPVALLSFVPGGPTADTSVIAVFSGILYLLELTETALLASDDRLLADLAALRETGVRLAIDDFGTGYSTLSYPAELPVDVVKMDRSFVERIATPGAEQRLALATGIVQMAVTLGYQVIAEGIETEAQRDLLASMGCHYGQGYLLAMPMNPDEARELARTGFPAPAPPHPNLGRVHSHRRGRFFD